MKNYFNFFCQNFLVKLIINVKFVKMSEKISVEEGNMTIYCRVSYEEPEKILHQEVGGGFVIEVEEIFIFGESINLSQLSTETIEKIKEDIYNRL